MKIKNFTEIDAWKEARILTRNIYSITNKSPFSRDFGLKDQMTRAAVSISSNIAEGAERDSKLEFIRFLHIAKGSAAELRTQMYIAHQVGIITNDVQTELSEKLSNVQKLRQNFSAAYSP